MNYDETVQKLTEEIYQFKKNYPKFDLGNYKEILKANGIKWDWNQWCMPINGKAVMALLLGDAHAERCYNGALLNFCKNGSVIRWLERLLKELEQR